jgi:cyclase
MTSATRRALIVAKIRPGSAGTVAEIFAESDRTSLPRDAGVAQRTLYALGDLYVHLVEFEGDATEAMATIPAHPGFAEVSERLRPYVSPYLPAWRSPRDAVAVPFYHWRAAA